MLLLFSLLKAEKCKLSEFQCPNDRCISKEQVCDGQSDWKAGDDEKDCKYYFVELVKDRSILRYLKSSK